MPKKQSLTSRLSLDVKQGSFTRPFANVTSSRSLQSRRSSSSLIGSLARSLTTRKPPASKLRVSTEHTRADGPESTPPAPGIHEQTSTPLIPTKTNPFKLHSLMTKFTSKFQKSTRNSPKNNPTPPSNGRLSQERRAAALRACGLLPQTDLSELEREQDLLIDSIDGRIADSDKSKGQSAADEIKRAWELKNAASLAPGDVPLLDPCQVPLPPSPAPSISDLAPVDELADSHFNSLAPSPQSEALRPKNPDVSFREWKFPKETSPYGTPSHSPASISHDDSGLLAPSSPIAESDSIMNASIATPSLTADSLTPTTLASSSADSILVKGSPIELRIQTSIAPGVPVIVESPIEEAPLFAIPESETVGCEKAKSLDLPQPVRHMTDPGQIKQKRPPRLSLRSIQRSVVGTLSSKPKSSRFDGLPPSPQLPTSPTLRLPLPSHSATTNTVQPPTLRVPRSPTMYSSSAIVLEASNIEDEESRRLSEMAFLI